MKKILCAAIIIMGICAPALGLEFTPPVIINQGISGSNYQPSFVVDNSNNIYAAWTNFSDSGRVYFGMSSDMGLTWTTPSIRVNESSGWWYRVNPSLRLNSGGNIYITWTFWLDGVYSPLYCSISSDTGVTWSEHQVDDETWGAKMYSCLIIDQYDTLYAIWHDERVWWLYPHPYFAKSIDGINWLPVPNVRVDSSFPQESQSYDPPRMVLDDEGVLYAVFHHDPDWHIYSKKSTDGGLTWGPCIDVSGAGVQDYSDIACDSTGMLYVVWMGGPIDTAQVYFSKSEDGGLSWSDTLRLATFSTCPKVAVDKNGNIYALWVSRPDFKLHLSISEDGGKTWSPPTPVCDTISVNTDQCAISLYVTPDGLICVAWDDDESNVYFSWADNVSPQVTVLSPNGSENFVVGDTCNITWFAEDNVGVDSISIYYSIDAGISWDTIATSEPNDSLYEWIIPNTPSDSCLVKVLAYDSSFNIGEDQSDSLFSIGPGGIEENISSPISSPLFQIRPNPFKEKTEISFSLGHGAKDAELKIYDVSGRIVRTLVPGDLCSGVHTVAWDGTDDSGNEVHSGVYFCRLAVSPVVTAGSGGKAGNYQSTKKLLRLQ